MNYGIIMKINQFSLFVMTPSGQFLSIRKRDEKYEVGQEISFYENEIMNQVKKKRKFIPKIRFLIPGLLVVSVIFFSVFSNIDTNKAYAYAFVDINPSIELTLNKKAEVIDIDAFNKDGEKVISEIKDWKGKNLNSVTDIIISSSEKDGFLKDEKRILLSFSYEKHDDDLKKEINKEVAELKTNNNIAVFKEEIPKKTREIAKREHISPAKYQMVEKEKNQSGKVKKEKLKTYKNKSINELSHSDNQLKPLFDNIKKEKTIQKPKQVIPTKPNPVKKSPGIEKKEIKRTVTPPKPKTKPIVKPKTKQNPINNHKESHSNHGHKK